MWSVKFSKIPLIFFFLGKTGNKNCKDLDIGKKLTELTKIPTPESFKFFLYSSF